jgi:hypothetical protein
MRRAHTGGDLPAERRVSMGRGGRLTRSAWLALVAGAVVTLVTVAAPTAIAASATDGFIGPLTHNETVASTVPGNGDVNPYGVAVVPESHRKLIAGDILVSNFNNAPTATAAGGLQGTGTTLVEISPSGDATPFATIPSGSVPGGVGLTTALVVLRSGWVIVGSLPTRDGLSDTAGPGELIVLDSAGQVRETIAGYGIDGPWDATAFDAGRFAVLFVSTVLGGMVDGTPAAATNGAVVRLLLDLTGSVPRVRASTVIGVGLPVHTDPAALVVGPTGLALGPWGELFVADTVNSRITRIPGALWRWTAADVSGPRATVSTDPALNSPLGLAMAPNGDLLAVNGGDNKLVELSRSGTVVAVRDLDTADPPGGALFGVATTDRPDAVYYVNDVTNTLDVLR